MPNHFSSIRLILAGSSSFPQTPSIEIFRMARDFPMKARSLECRKNCFLGERLIYLISEFLTWAWGLNSGRVLERNAFTNSTRWVAVERCENSSERKGERKCEIQKKRENEREKEEKRERSGVWGRAGEREGGERESSRRRGLAIWFCNLDKESFLPRYWLLRVPTSSLLKLNGISQPLWLDGGSPRIVSSTWNF